MIGRGEQPVLMKQLAGEGDRRGWGRYLHKSCAKMLTGKPLRRPIEGEAP